MKKLLLSMALLGATIAGAQAQVTATFSDSLTVNSPMFDRPVGGLSPQFLQGSPDYYYTAFTFTIPTAGTYSFQGSSNFDNFGILYNGSGFDPADPLANAIQADDDAGGAYNFLITQTLAAGTYTLVATSYSGTMTGDFSVIVDGSAVVSLPLNLLSFSATREEAGRAVITWSTGNEDQVSHFEVQKSADAAAYTTLKRVAATNGPGNTYSAVDNALQAGKTYYRLKMVDVDGSTSYSKTQVVVNELRTPGAAAVLTPNPAGAVTALVYRAPAAGTVSVQVADVQGRVVLSRRFDAQQGTNTLPLDLQSVSAGTYFLHWTGNSTHGMLKLERR